ncbi:MAG TPA: VacJ family lipoprotein [Rhizomicrobium sp.]|nr:VacJ family lipoprotein [Rhizomicrobium sp.]
MRTSWAALTIALGLVLAGCASTSTTNSQLQTDPDDPLEGWNRQVFDMNQRFDEAIMKPTAEAYIAVVPEPARKGVHNFLTNLNSPVVFANDLLQGEVGLAGETVGRFGLNTTIGLGGLVDVATPAGIPGHSSDFGQTLGVWGVGEDPYLVLPLLGPSNPRDLAGYVADQAMSPLNYVGIRDYTYWSIGAGAVNIVDERAQNMDTLNQLEQTSLDPYASMRSLYRQYRRSHIRHGKSSVKDLPSM